MRATWITIGDNKKKKKRKESEREMVIKIVDNAHAFTVHFKLIHTVRNWYMADIDLIYIYTHGEWTYCEVSHQKRMPNMQLVINKTEHTRWIYGVYSANVKSFIFLYVRTTYMSIRWCCVETKRNETTKEEEENMKTLGPIKHTRTRCRPMHGQSHRSVPASV